MGRVSVGPPRELVRRGHRAGRIYLEDRSAPKLPAYATRDPAGWTSAVEVARGVPNHTRYGIAEWIELEHANVCQRRESLRLRRLRSTSPQRKHDRQRYRNDGRPFDE